MRLRHTVLAVLVVGCAAYWSGYRHGVNAALPAAERLEQVEHQNQVIIREELALKGELIAVLNLEKKLKQLNEDLDKLDQ